MFAVFLLKTEDPNETLVRKSQAKKVGGPSFRLCLARGIKSGVSSVTSYETNHGAAIRYK